METIDEYTEKRLKLFRDDIEEAESLFKQNLICNIIIAESLIKLVGILAKIENKMGK